MEDSPKIYQMQGRFLPMVIVTGFIALMFALNDGLRPDQIFIVLVFSSLVLFGGRTGKRFIIDWAPFTIFLILYDGMRGLADNFGAINVVGPYQLEKTLFGWVGGGRILPFALQGIKSVHSGDFFIKACDGIAGTMYSLHFVVPFVFGWVLWSVYHNRKEFYFFAYSLTILNILALITFFLYPAAPPWYVWKYHFATPLVGAVNYRNAGGLLSFDALLNLSIFKSVYEVMNPNPFAAIPSLHGSYPLLVSFFAFRRWKAPLIRIGLFIYVAMVWFSACYLNHHYIIDLIIGAIYVATAILLYKYIVGPYLIEPVVFSKKRTTVDLAGSAEHIKNPLMATLLFFSLGLVLLVIIISYAIKSA